MRAKNYYPPTTKNKENPSRFGSIRTLLLACLLMVGLPVASFAQPAFVGPRDQNYTGTVCQNPGTLDFTDYLAITTPSAETITWQIISSTGSGTTNGASTAPVTPGLYEPFSPFDYTPDAAFTGNASVTVIITNGVNVPDTTTVHFTVSPYPTAITGPNSVCRTQSITLASTPGTGTWSSSNSAIATVDVNSGVVTGAGFANGPAGNFTITYTLPSGCTATKSIVLNRLSTITLGATDLCAFSGTTTANTATFGGVWSSTTAPIATTGVSNSATVTAQGPGTAVITYTMPTGCASTASLTINPLPDPIIIGSNDSVCQGLTISLSNQTAGGTWSSSNPSTATVDGSGNVTGVNGGVVNISYILPTGCNSTVAITVNETPAIGSGSACLGQTISLAAVPAGGVWTTSNTNITLTPSGDVTGTGAGDAVVTYTSGAGCVTTGTLTINPVPDPITGPTAVCVNSTINLTDATPGGNWNTSNGNASVDGNGAVTGISEGSVVIIYTLPTTCYATTTVTVNPISAIFGSDQVCKGAQVDLDNTALGGTWSSSNANATIDPATGLLTGVDAGTTTITYVTPAGCSVTRTQFINPLPDAITGTTTVCKGSTTTLSNGGGGTWSSANLFIAVVDANTGVVSGNNAGNTTITYILPTGCATSTTLTVYPNDPIINGGGNICIGNTVTLSNPVAGGAWTTSNTNVTVDANGVVTGVDAGTADITYTTAFGCESYTTVTVDPLPGNITGTFSVCEDATQPLFNGTPGGTWSSSNTSVATIDENTGVVTGVSGGTVDITYMMPTGCFTTEAFTVNPKAVISGIPYVCVTGQQPFSASITGGIWFIDGAPAANASINPATGLVTGVSAGLALIDYILPTGCITYQTITVGTPPPITASATTVCEGSTVTLSNISGPGTWSSDNTNVATVSNTGVVTGVAQGTANIFYSLSAGCNTSIGITVNPLPVIENEAVCVGSFRFISHTPNGGTWSSSNTSVATINVNSGAGTVYGVDPGTAFITYTLPTTCAISNTVIVNPNPTAITGNRFICPGVTSTLSNATAGGTWTSSNVSNATIDANSGVYGGVSTGFSAIRYTLATGCFAQAFVSVQNTTPAITGPTPSTTCVGQTIELNNTSTGGTWSSNLTSIAAVDDTGAVTGIGAGTSIITYSLGGTCRSIRAVEVNALSEITGPSVVCEGSSIALSNETFGGSWQMGDASGIATVDAATGVLTGITAGTTTVEYVLPSGCFDVDTITVNPNAAPIAGAVPGVCIGSSITLSNSVAGGTWTSSNTAIALIDTFSGVVTSVAVGNTTIVYQLTTGCTSASVVLLVNPLPVLTSADTITICNNTLVNYTPVSSLGGSTVFQWTRDLVAGISNPQATGSDNPNTSPSTEVLENTTTDPVAVKYMYSIYNNVTTCVNTDSVIVIVNPTPRLTSPAVMPSICDSATFTYTATSATSGVGFDWSRPAIAGIEPATSTGTGDIAEQLINTTTNPIVVSYLYTLTFDGCTHVDTVKVTVNPTPRLSSPAVMPAICDSATFNYPATSLTAAVTFDWSRPAVTGIVPATSTGSGDINEQLVNNTANPVVVTYLYTLTVDGCSNVDTVRVTVNPTPRFSSTTTPAAICDSVLFSYNPTSATAGTTFTWTRDYIPGIDLLAGSGTGNPNEVLVNTTNIDVTVTYHYTLSANGCSHEQDVNVIVHPRPRLSSATGPFSICSGTTFAYFPTGYVLGTTFAWTRPQVAGVSPNTGSGTGVISEVLVDSLLAPKTVDYKIVMTANGCKDSTHIQVVVNPSYTFPEIKTNTPTEVCLGTMNQLFWVDAPAPAGVTYTWTATNATVISTGNPDQYALVNFDSSAGPAYITIKSNVTGFACTNNSRSIFLNVKSTRADVMQIIYYNGQFMCLNNDQDTYQWGYDDALTLASTTLTGETNQTYFNSAPDLTYRKYWVNTTHNGCFQKTYFNAPVGVTEVTDAISLEVYPNPVTDLLNVDINTRAGGKFELEVVDVLGQKISAVTAVNHRAKVNVSGLAPGMYMIECYRDGVKVNATRFIKN